MREHKPYLGTACDLKCLRVIEGFLLFPVSTLSVKILTPARPLLPKKKTEKKGKKKTMKKTSSEKFFANNK